MSYGRRHVLRVMRMQARQSSVYARMRYHTVAHSRTRGKQGKLTVLILPPLSISLFSSPGAACGVEDAGFESALLCGAPA